MRSARLLALVCLAGTVTACAGNHGSSPFVPNAPAQNRPAPAAKRLARLTVRVRIPKHRHARSHYISAATKGMTMAFTGTATFTQTFNLTPASSNCTGTPLTCTFQFALEPGTYNATVNTYNEAPVSGAIPGGAKVLSTVGNVPLTVVSGTANHAGFTLDGVPAGVDIHLPKGVAGSGFLNATVLVDVTDAGGDTIVGSYTTPVTLSDSDTSGSTAIATSGSDNPPARELLSSTDSATLSYTGQAIAPPTITGTDGTIKDTSLFQISEPVFVADTGNLEIKDIPYECTGPTCVQMDYGGPPNLVGLAVDASGSLYYADANAKQVIRMAPCFTGYCVAADIVDGFSNMHGVGVDATDTNTFVSSGSSVYLVTGSCNKPSCAQELAHSTFIDPQAIAVDSSENVYVADPSLGQIIKIPSSCVASPGSPCTTTALGGNTFVTPQGVAVDGNGNVFVADTFGQAYEMPNTCTTDSCVITVGAGFFQPAGIAVDSFGNVFVLDIGSTPASVEEVKAGCSFGCQISLGGGFNSPAAIAVP